MLSNNKKTNHKLLFIPTYVEGAVQHLHFEVFIYVLKLYYQDAHPNI